MSEHSEHAVSVESSAEIRSGFLAVLGVLFMVILIATIWLLRSLYVEVAENQYLEKIANVGDTRLDALRQQESAQLSNYKALNKEKGQYQMPVAEAMKLVVSDYAKLPIGAPVPAPAPEAAPADGGAPVEGAPAVEGAAVPAANPAEGAVAPAEAAAAPAPAPAETKH